MAPRGQGLKCACLKMRKEDSAVIAKPKILVAVCDHAFREVPQPRYGRYLRFAAERECRHGKDESNSSHVLTILRRAFLIEAVGRRQELAAQRARESHQKLNWWAEDAESPEQKCKAWRRKSRRCEQLLCLD